MALYYIVFLAAVQGVTEFLPISSSAHLILARDLLVALGLPADEGSAAEFMFFRKLNIVLKHTYSMHYIHPVNIPVRIGFVSSCASLQF